MSAFRITALPAAVAAVQAVPLADPPFTGYVGESAWGEGDPVIISRHPTVFDPDGKVYWGITDDQFYAGLPPEGVNEPPEGSEWDLTQSLAALNAIAGVTVEEEE